MNNLIFIVSCINETGDIMSNLQKICVFGEDLENYIHTMMMKPKFFIYNYTTDNLFLQSQSQSQSQSQLDQS